MAPTGSIEIGGNEALLGPKLDHYRDVSSVNVKFFIIVIIFALAWRISLANPDNIQRHTSDGG